MSHDKTRAAARQRMTRTGEPYTAARRGVASAHQAAGQDPPGSQAPPAGSGYLLAMSGEIRDWLADLHTRDPAAAAQVGNALATLMEEGASLGEPMVASTADSWPWALLEALDQSYAERLERLTMLRRGEAEAATLVHELLRLLAELGSTKAKLAGPRRNAATADGQPQAEEAAGLLAATERQEAEVRRLLTAMTEAKERLGEQSRRLQPRTEAFRVRKEVLKASYVAASGSLRVREAMPAASPAGDAAGLLADDAETIGAARARLADLTAGLEREVGQQAWPAGLMALRPGGSLDSGFCLLFAAEPARTALLLAVLEGTEAVHERYPEALLAAANRLREVRAGQAPEPAAHVYADSRSFLAEFYPRGGGGGAGGGTGPGPGPGAS